MFPPDQTAELSTPAGRKPRADVTAAADSFVEGRSEHLEARKVGVWEEGAIINDRYTLERRLGGGSMGVVFLARDRLLKKPVALKVLRADMAASRATVRRFLREVALAHSVTHPNVVRIYDTGEADGLPYFSMEFLQGQTLEELIEASRGEGEDVGNPPMTLREIREMSYEILSGLAAAHAAGIVHRDLKPANVMLTHRGAIVMDFGVAGFDVPDVEHRPNPAEARSLVRTEAGTIFGSPAYMAPELWEGAPATVQSDLYSFGVMLYQMLSGRLPIEAPNAKAFLVRLKSEKPVPVRQLRKDTPWNLSLLVGRCMNHDPEQRPASAEAAANLVAPLVGRWRWIGAALALVVAALVAVFVLRSNDEDRYLDLGLPDPVARADLDAFVRSYDVGDYEAAARQLDRLEIRAPDSAAVVFWRSTLTHDLGDESARRAHCEVAQFEAERSEPAWRGSETWLTMARRSCDDSYTLARPLRALLDQNEASPLPESWLPLAVHKSLVPRLEAARVPGPMLRGDADDALARLDEGPSFSEGPMLATRWQLARVELRLALGRADEARALLEELVAARPDVPLVLSRAADFYATIAERERASEWARAVAIHDPRPAVRLLLDAGRLREAGIHIDRYGLAPGPRPFQQQLLDMWCGYAYRFEIEPPPPRCSAVSPGLVHNLWIGARTDLGDQRVMSALEREIVNQQAALNRGECRIRAPNEALYTHALPPFQTYLRQLDVSSALCSSDSGAQGIEAARLLVDELASLTPADPWVLLIDATVDEAQGQSEAANDKRRRAADRWRDADPDLPLVVALRELLGEPASALSTESQVPTMTPADGPIGLALPAKSRLAPPKPGPKPRPKPGPDAPQGEP